MKERKAKLVLLNHVNGQSYQSSNQPTTMMTNAAVFRVFVPAYVNHNNNNNNNNQSAQEK